MEQFRALLVVDAEKFSAHPDKKLPDVHLEIRRVLGKACQASGLGEAWENAQFKESTGDGVLAALPHESSAALIDPFPRRLQDALHDAAPEFRARELRLRLRVALHVGLVDDERLDAPGISTATVDVNRLLDSDPLRDALEHSDPRVTFAAFLLSEEIFRPYVLGEWTSLRESQFTEVAVKVKQYARPAYLYVPVPSVKPVEPSAGPPEEAPPRPSTGGANISGVTFSGDGAQAAFGNTVGGDLRQGRSS
ncbi:hypothetical protein [Actinomadura rugatobispora]|uniref:Uncharacterized protein n=1 Tax=Actinomadura rugatobispora TaxID=1994 RepID=A0ABW0ZQS8_9ACTN|nr:hypothetical protein GCM10010200_058330 [Actinomadura rugatobispora]